MIVGLVLAVALQAPSVGAPLVAFDSACARLDGIDTMDSRLSESGWERFTATQGSELSRVVAAIETAPAGIRVDTRIFKRAAQPDLVVLGSQVYASDGSGSIECQVLSESAVVPSLDQLREWAGTAPTKVLKKNGILTWVWQSGRSADQPFLAVTYTPASAKRRFPGVGLSVRTVKFLS
ncbi:hypothetical protein [Sphingomonas sp.]|uniref:hypothetical protein n=1 Tax=Sphingomonas sp. TaxID=28214 RepID=UPI002B79875C|nr:hypothetical protein [Sphingomonas sp.]HWK37095.1 hypothetical protein [Sphingomonas sp.]